MPDEPKLTKRQVSRVTAPKSPVIPKLRARVRFPSPAPRRRPRSATWVLFVVRTSSAISCQIRAEIFVAVVVRGLSALGTCAPVRSGGHLRLPFVVVVLLDERGWRRPARRAQSRSTTSRHSTRTTHTARGLDLVAALANPCTSERRQNRGRTVTVESNDEHQAPAPHHCYAPPQGYG